MVTGGSFYLPPRRARKRHMMNDLDMDERHQHGQCDGIPEPRAFPSCIMLVPTHVEHAHDALPAMEGWCSISKGGNVRGPTTEIIPPKFGVKKLKMKPIPYWTLAVCASLFMNGILVRHLVDLLDVNSLTGSGCLPHPEFLMTWFQGSQWRGDDTQSLCAAFVSDICSVHRMCHVASLQGKAANAA